MREKIFPGGYSRQPYGLVSQLASVISNIGQAHNIVIYNT